MGLNAQALQPVAPIDLRPALIVLAFLLFLVDALASLYVSGGLKIPVRAKRAALSLAMLGLAGAAFALAPGSAIAQDSSSSRTFEAALRTRLAYVVTGDARVDEASRLGLGTLSRALSARTALSPGEPVGVDPARDELSFYPLIYWPIVPERAQPTANAVIRIGAFMKEGGTIVFDTRDALSQRPDGPPTPETRWLRQLLAGVDVPELEPVPRDHVVTKTFYLLDSFVGRTSVGQTWIEALPPGGDDRAQRPARTSDSVSPIVITSNDLAVAWAADKAGQPLYPLTPGTNRQREMAIRGGVNLVMYTLTGNYKSDQVHVRDLLERLGL
jgi:hypothetical protein